MPSAPRSRRFVKGRLATVWAFCFNTGFREARRVLLGLRKSPASPLQLAREVDAAIAQIQNWRQSSDINSLPRPLSNLELHKSRFDAAISRVAGLAAFFPKRELGKTLLAELENLLAALSEDVQTPGRIPRLLQIEREIEKLGAREIISEIQRSDPEPSAWPRLFDSAWLCSCFDAACAEDPLISGFNGKAHNRFVESFCQLDRERLEIASARVRRAHAERAIQALNAHEDQQFLIRREVEKKRRILPLRKLVAQAPDVLTSICPCWMASPLSVSQILDAERQYFDFVIFDEASQILPEDAVPSILRGARVVVAGDQNQLPPTTFFSSGNDDDDGNEEEELLASEGFESLLDLMNSFLPPWPLEWHYRSRDESLIAFSNHYIYQDRLVTFPGPRAVPAVSHVLVQQESGKDGEEESSTAEVRKVVDLVLRHAAERPSETLGVIAMGIKHARRVEAALDQALEKRPDLEEFFDLNRPHRFFVKNLERVQGDERDAIILTIGYGKDRGGKLPFRFGPLLNEGGRRRLNVAVTRSRNRMTVVSSFSHLDMDLAKIRPGTGVELLRFYLQYAATRGKQLGDGTATAYPLNEFESDIFDALTAKGIPLIPQVERPATASTLRRSIPTSLADWCWPSSVTARRITPPPPRAIATGCASSIWRHWAGSSTESGPPTGSCARRKRSRTRGKRIRMPSPSPTRKTPVRARTRPSQREMIRLRRSRTRKLTVLNRIHKSPARRALGANRGPSSCRRTA